MYSDFEAINVIKKNMVVFVLALRDLGLVQDLSFLNNLIKLHDIFIDKLLDNVEARVNEALEKEDHN